MTADSEGQWMTSLDGAAKVRFLARLTHALTIAGRSASYEGGTQGLIRPEYLRSINEIQHRVSACLVEVLSGDASESFERSIAGWVLEPSDAELRRHTAYAWQHAKSYVQRAT